MATVESYDVRSVDRGEVLRYLGYAGQPITPELDARIDEVVARCLAACRPRGSWGVFDVAARGEKGGVPVISLAGTSLELRGRSIAEHLDGAVAVGALAVTVGMGVEAELRRLSLTDPLAQVVFDAAGTAAVERAADAAEASVVAEAASRGLFCGTRFSPGYGDLPLATQPVLLAALDAQRALGITLSRALLMSPTKSVTAVVGLFERPRGTAHASCAGCPCRDFCVLLRAGSTCRG
ncbi:vitamin B12 dependent-methionine synthase activation domain-containing protein [Thermophilibacter provencensis]|uniref:vitamin B12 dependent-methionine synthase activation domain-containing protein n=1 Tax=Thermophilibacter provencensis TaxID=1852386 RepID=UPI002353FE5A|nr:vitamin B12 dependent-methionine synthase activation domain-containing protein [Thermophilibacter provencensis]